MDTTEANILKAAREIVERKRDFESPNEFLELIVRHAASGVRETWERPNHLKLFWRVGIEEALMKASESGDTPEHDKIVRKQIDEYLLHMLPRFDTWSEHGEEQLMLLTYYSTLLAEHGETSTFKRMPVSLIDLAIDSETPLDLEKVLEILEKEDKDKTREEKDLEEEFKKILEKNVGKNAVSNIVRAFRKECTIFKDAPTAQIFKPSELKSTLEPAELKLNPDTGSVESRKAIQEDFVNRIQENPLAPVNLAEAFNVDFHLTPPSYRDIVDETLFAGLDEDAPKNAPQKLEIILDLLKSNELATAAYAIFEEKSKDVTSSLAEIADTGKKTARKETDEKAEQEIGEKAETREPLITKKIEKKIKNLTKQIKFEFASLPPHSAVLERHRIRPENLQKMAIALLGGCLPDSEEVNHIALYELFNEATAPLDDTRHGHLHKGQKLSACPSLPFFLAALVWNGTYADLLKYILPIYLLDVEALHVHTVAYCDSPTELLGQIVLSMRREPSLKLVSQNNGISQTLSDRIRLMIRHNAIGNLVLLRRHRASPRPQLHECLSCHGFMSTLDCSVRGVLVPLRRGEHLVEAQKETERAKELGRALIHDLRTKFYLLTRASEFDEEFDIACEVLQEEMHEDDFAAVEQAWESLEQIPWLSIWCQAFHDYYSGSEGEKQIGYRSLTLDQFIAKFAESAPFNSGETIERIKNALNDCKILSRIASYPAKTFALVFENLFKNIHKHALEETLDIRFSVAGKSALKPDAPEGVWFGVEIENVTRPDDKRGDLQGTKIINTMCNHNIGRDLWAQKTEPPREGIKKTKEGEIKGKIFNYKLECRLECEPSDIFEAFEENCHGRNG